MVNKVGRGAKPKNRHTFEGKPKNIMQKRDIKYKISKLFRSPNIRPVLFLIPFVVVTAIIMLFLSRADVVIKPPVAGLMTRAGNLPTSPTYIDTMVIQLDWADLSPTAANQANIDDYSAAGWKAIDNQLAGRTKAVRLRILAGVSAPNWVKATYPSGKGAVDAAAIGEPGTDGYKPAIECTAGIGYRNDFDDVGGCIPYFWTTEVLDKYQELMHKVAHRYETNPKVREIVDSACMTYYAEPFYRAGAGNYDRLHDAGLTYAKDRACHERAVNIHKTEFTTTRTSLAINSWDNVDTRTREWPIAEDFGNWAKAQLGERLTLQNNGFGVQEGCPTYTGSNGTGPTHCFIANSGLNHGWQTRTFQRIYEDVHPPVKGETLTNEQKCEYFKEGIFKTLENAKRSGASFVELPSNPSIDSTDGSTKDICNFDKLDAYHLDGFSTLQQYDTAFEATASKRTETGTGGSRSPPPSTSNAADAKGIWMVWGTAAIAQKPFVKGGQVVGDWTAIEPTNNTFNWDALGASEEANVTVNDYLTMHKPFTVQINSTKKPCSSADTGCVGSTKKACASGESGCLNANGQACTSGAGCLSTTQSVAKPRWSGYGTDIAWCGILHPKNSYNLQQDVPKFWDNTASDGVNAKYITIETDLISALSTYLQSASYKNQILGIRTAPNLIGTEHSTYNDDGITDIPNTDACKKSNYPSAAGQNAYDKVMNLYKQSFVDTNSGLKPIYRGDQYLNPSKADVSSNVTKELFFNTNGNPDTVNQYATTDKYYPNVANGPYQAYYEPFLGSSNYTSPVTWNYWLILEQLSRGVNYIGVYGTDLDKAATDSCPDNIVGSTGNNAKEYEMAYCFGNKYAPFANARNTATQAKASPGAWLAFTRADHSQGASGAIGMYLNASGITDSNSSPANLAIPATVNNDAMAAQGNLGNATQRYGRYARSITSSQTLAMSFDANFKTSIAGTSPIINVTYLDSGTGTVTVHWGSTTKTFTKTNSGNWATYTTSAPASALPSSGNDVMLNSSDTTTFHMVEVIRGGSGGCTGDCQSPTVGISSPAAGATVSGSVNVEASATDDVGVTKVEFYIDDIHQTPDDSSAPYSFNWNTSSVTNGAHTLKAIAFDNASHSTTSSSVTITVSNDVTPPTVSITAPSNNSTLNDGSVNVSVSASDDRAVTKVEFYVDGSLNSNDTTSPYLFSWNATAGDHSLTAKAYDAVGHTATSAAANVHINHPDTTAPTVTITAPSPGATVSGTTVSITANATDNVGVASVEFFVDGATIASDTTAPYSTVWDSTSLADGPHSISAKAYDAARNVATSNAVNATIANGKKIDPDTTPPTASITAPTANATVVGNTNITADASDNVGVTSVEVYIDGSRSADADVAAPYVFGWDTTSLPNGSHSIYVIVYDAAGNTKTSATITVLVDNPVGPGAKNGDANGDNKVDVFDLSALASHWGDTNATRAEGDLNGDGIINIYDLSILATNWGK